MDKNEGHSCQKKEFELYNREINSFHIGFDGKLYFTDIGTKEFCIDTKFENVDDSSDEINLYDYEDNDYLERKRRNIIIDSESDMEETEMTMDQDYIDYEEACHTKKHRPISVDILYCAPKIIYVPKCCDDNMMVNLKL